MRSQRKLPLKATITKKKKTPKQKQKKIKKLPERSNDKFPLT